MEVRGKETPAGCFFAGVNVSVELGRSFFPIVTVDKKKIHVDEGIKTKKAPQNAPVRMRLKTRVSDRFVDVLELDFGTSSMANLKRSSDAIADMQLAQALSEFNLRRAAYQIHFFSENGEQVAMSNSRALKSLTQEGFQKFQESLGKRKS